MKTDATEIREAKDWQGRQLDCSRCERFALEQNGQCQRGHACVHDRYARRVDRFFRWHPKLAAEYLRHPYFEVRAIAAKYVEVFQLPSLVNDPDETVRRSVAERLPSQSKHLKVLKRDPHREVRIRVAQRIVSSELGSMVEDEDYLVRQYVAKRLAPSTLVKILHDPEVEVRKVVANRISVEWLPVLMKDPSIDVRCVALRRVAADHLRRYRADEHWRIRYEVALRIDQSELYTLVDDPDPLVRETVQRRMQGQDVLSEAC